MATKVHVQHKDVHHNLSVDGFIQYTPCYCEENIYQLAKLFDGQGQVVFITTKTKTTPIWEQKVGKEPDGLVVWDYHVVFLSRGTDNNDWNVWDFDSKLPFPTTWSEYRYKALKRVQQTYEGNVLDPDSPCLERCFRVVSAKQYLDHFSSDRSHMRTETGDWLAPPPLYPPIGKGRSSNLETYLDMQTHIEDSVFGRVHDEDSIDSMLFTSC
ncbi:hypothetical protein SJAG_00450 [Schizosaccharomyces japonicus yFS275]|uniref:Protein N-terminal glutamine amidohydrolase n=1 Tax=Schizosaccharomyces japonicus (strain yFS275 / FY16936) TaxID=402676 RepID=B6JVN5_SCHJY|nr:hypothetical protein SJAG_00450 [Schizosaccharomyces japonicus yFS275]EEB05436.2 hypothetical protein SJAG_00450 [Schizosaccharomyces japonicus yFS275]